MATITFKGLEEYTAKLNRLSALSRDKIIGAAIYDGAAIVADAIKAELNALPTDEGHEHKKTGPEQSVKDALIQHMGIAPLQNDNSYLNVKVGFDGYDARGRPVPMLARAVQSGTSFMTGHPFVKDALRKSRKQAQAAIKKRVEEEIQKTMN